MKISYHLLIGFLVGLVGQVFRFSLSVTRMPGCDSSLPLSPDSRFYSAVLKYLILLLEL